MDECYPIESSIGVRGFSTFLENRVTPRKDNLRAPTSGVVR